MKLNRTRAILTNVNNKVRKLSSNYTSACLQTAIRAKRWFNNPKSEYIIRFFTCNDEDGMDFDYETPDNIDLDWNCWEIGQDLLKRFGVTGKYFYDVRVTQDSWEIVRTNNPRCTLGNPLHRKDCDYLKGTYNPKLTIEGYTLSGNYFRFREILDDLVNKTIIVHSKSDVKAIMRIVRFLGVNQTLKNKRVHPNNPDKPEFCIFSKLTFGYKLKRENGQVFLQAVPKSELPTNTDEILDIDELIIKRSLKAMLRDRA